VEDLPDLGYRALSVPGARGPAGDDHAGRHSRADL